jgi:tRNA-Thr(GGU) m(6)t(6)A37 methyltransferase TsaA
MDRQPPDMKVKFIGIVSSQIKQIPPKPGYDWQAVESRITMDQAFTEALESLDKYSHIIVIYWLHKAYIRQYSLRVHPHGDTNLPLVGLFASRSPYRPNPVGTKTVQLIKRQGNTLWVRGLDAIDGTPVIDIKPFIPGSDSPDEAEVPEWDARQNIDS